MTKVSKHDRARNVRNFIFGVEDSLVSTVGLLSGVAIAGVTKSDLFITGVVLIFVEAFSMASGSFLSEHSAEVYENKKDNSLVKPLFAALIMLFSYFLSGFIPLMPYILFPREMAFILSISVSLISLFFLGVIGGVLFRTNFLRRGLEMLIVGGLAIGVGVIVGNALG